MKTADPELMRAINRFHVMDAIRRAGPIARVEISDLTQLSPTTVSAITAALLDDGLVMPRALGDLRNPSADMARGRPRVLLELNPKAAYVVGAKLAPDHITVATTDFCAETLASLTLPIRISRQPVSVIADLVEDGVQRCIADAGLPIEQIAGLCVGLPGRIERETGICQSSPIFGETNIPFAARLQERLGITTVIESAVNLVTMAESWFGEARGIEDFLVVSLEHTLGLGIMYRGDLFRGAQGLGPDLDGLLIESAKGAGAPQRLRAIASEAAILADAETILQDAPHRAAFRAGRGMAAIMAAAREGDARILAILQRAGEALGFAIANLVTLFAPRMVVLAGEAFGQGEVLLDALRARLAALLPPDYAPVPDIAVHRWSEDSWARGAAALTLRDLYGAPWNTTGPARPG
ncbi:MAG TPA: ROK family transcriptional regulator [Acidisoma sp.]|jgi:predicted NBD/HSP70 family sugar kinase|uniref:ROK family transcriptional regulator n=1 Tax=Acidisoma sp. TaxID=1872115 RepID=UPI002CF11E3A|nr:ROK family transcriptional regulator [Acidisoma sp.]HTH99625.1 ROK family transcriptional regulator [Acidisoma sp.]